MRKKLLFTLLALLGMTQAVAQEYEYVPFVREGVKWHYSYKDKTYFDYEHKSTLELKGDVNGDGFMNIHDITQLNDWLENSFQGANIYHLDASDVNGDGILSIADVTTLSDIILGA
jgi:hypothetical protein